MPHVVVQAPGAVAIAVQLSSTVRFGRDPVCEFVLDDGKVSRLHATLTADHDGWWLADHASRHGSWLNGRRVDRARLADGDRIQLGATIVTFRDAAAAPDAVVTYQLDATAPAASAAPERGAFYHLATALRASADRDHVLGSALAAIVAATRAARGVIALAPRPGGAPRRVADHAAEGVVISRALLDATARGEAIVVEAAPTARTTLEAQGIGAAMAAPIHLDGRVAGVAYVDHPSPGRFGADDLAFLAAAATLVGAAGDAAGRVERAEARAEAATLGLRPPVLLGVSPPMLALRRDIERLGPTELALHVTGETGAGKELVARALHAASARAAAPLVAVNCAALPDALVESELFGHVRGAFTGATSTRRGRFALAAGGTLFLDEIADLSLAAQAKILRVLEDGEVTPVGGEQPIRIDVRVVSASHKDLRGEVAAGRFREDLYYRLVVAELAVPPLRARGDDVALLADEFLAAARAKGARATHLSPAARSALIAHAWPGNVRELRNVIERAAALAQGAAIDIAELRLHVGREPERAAPAGRAAPTELAAQFAALDQTEHALVAQALAAAGGNVAEAARLLGISRIMMRRRIERFGLGAGADDHG